MLKVGWERVMLPIAAKQTTSHHKDRPLEGELLDAEDESRQRLRRQLRDVSHWLDTAFEIPGLRWRFGLDPIIGLFPVAGDLTATFLSLYILAAAVRLGAPRSTLARMGLNIAIDNTLGAIPLLGNVFDFVWKANKQNMDLIRERATGKNVGTTGDYIFVFVVIGILIAILIGSILISVFLIGWLLKVLLDSSSF